MYFKENIHIYRYIDKYYISANGEAKHYYIIKALYNLTNKQNLLF